DPERAIREGLKVCSAVYTCVTKRAQCVSSIPWMVERRQSDGEWAEVPDHPVTELLKNPNPDLSRADAFELAQMNLDLSGEWHITKTRVAGRTSQEVGALWVLPVRTLEPRVSKSEGITGFKRVRYASGQPDLPREDVIYGLFRDPSNIYRGLAPLKAAARAVDTDVQAAIANLSIMLQAVRPTGVLSILGKLTDPNREHMEQQLNQRHKGAANLGKVLLVGNAEAKFTPFSLSVEELMSLGIRQMSMREVFAIYGTPPPIAGWYEDATYNNIKTALEIFWLLTIIPLLQKHAGVLNRDLMPEFGQGDLRIMYDVSGIQALSRITPEAVRSALSMQRMGMTLRDINRTFKFGWGELPYDDVAWMPSNMVPVEQALGADNSSARGLRVLGGSS
ncbi:MAG: phage portal protein, partial [Myxococcota bacterium]